MPISRPYFNLHQVITGQYTSGNEYVFDDGTDYIGPYHILPTEQLFTGPRPERNSQEVFPKRTDVNDDILRYNLNTENTTSRYETPVAINPIPTSNDYTFGEMERFFVQKRNSPLNSIIEIDNIQFNKINTRNNPGINGVLWNRLKLTWKISKIPREDTYIINQRQVIEAENRFPGIGKFLSNPLEFYK